MQCRDQNKFDELHLQEEQVKTGYRDFTDASQTNWNRWVQAQAGQKISLGGVHCTYLTSLTLAIYTNVGQLSIFLVVNYFFDNISIAFY